MTAAGGWTRLWLVIAIAAYAADRGVGERLYMGRAPLRAELAGASDDLEQEAARCVNCHGRDGRGIPESEVQGSDIRPAVLKRATPRRGGPPSRYDRVSFCAALRLGLDPAGVVLARGMPRYRISMDDCGALWNFLEELQSKRE